MTGQETTRDLPVTAGTVVLDIDGTLVDSTYHHTVAWVRSFAAHGHQVAGWRVHRAIGMGGDRLVAAVVGDAAEEADGDAVRERWQQEFDQMISETTLLPGAVELIDALGEAGFTVVLASSSIPEHARRALDLLEAGRRVSGWTTADDAESSKPDPELVETALAKVGGGQAVLVGDSVWDVEAGARAGIPVIGVRCGGFGADELLEAGAVAVYDDPADLVARLDQALRPADS